jgi:DNA-binding LytR/AlgR family response regulator
MSKITSKANRSQVSNASEGIYVKPVSNEMRVKVCRDDILWVEAENTRSTIHLVDGSSILVARSISYVEGRLAPYGIVRINRSEMVNIRYVREYVAGALYLECDELRRIHTVTDSYRDGVFQMFDEL